MLLRLTACNKKAQAHILTHTHRHAEKYIKEGVGRQGGKAAQRRPGSAQNAARTELWQTADVQTIKFKDIAYSCVCVCEREGNASALAGAICNRVCCILCGRIARGSSCACVDFSSPVNNTHTQTHPVHTHTCALCLPSACLLSFNYANAKCKQ